MNELEFVIDTQKKQLSETLDIWKVEKSQFDKSLKNGVVKTPWNGIDGEKELRHLRQTPNFLFMKETFALVSN